MLLDGQPLTVAFAVLAQPCDPKANETEMGAVLFQARSNGVAWGGMGWQCHPCSN